MRKHHKRYARRRLEILRSAAAAFSRQGFSSATMEEIGDALDLTKGSLYYYFKSKQDLLYFCQQYSLDRLLEEADRITSSDAPRPRQLYDLIVSQIRCMLDELQGAAAHIEFRRLPEDQLREIIRKRDRFESVFRELIQAGIEEGAFHRRDPRVVGWAILGAINWTVQWFSPRGELSVQDIAEDFAHFLVSGLTRPDCLDLALADSNQSTG